MRQRTLATNHIKLVVTDWTRLLGHLFGNVLPAMFGSRTKRLSVDGTKKLKLEHLRAQMSKMSRLTNVWLLFGALSAQGSSSRSGVNCAALAGFVI